MEKEKDEGEKGKEEKREKNGELLGRRRWRCEKGKERKKEL